MANQLEWRKASFSALKTDCVEVASSPTKIGIRDSKNIGGGEVWAPSKAWASFIVAVRSGSLMEPAVW